MPPEAQLDEKSIAILTKWVKLGAPWPTTHASQIRAAAKSFTEQDRQWWAVQPVKDPEVPQADSEWAENEIDHFVARPIVQMPG